MNSKPAILYLTHKWEPVHAQRFKRLRNETIGMADCHVLLQSDYNSTVSNGLGPDPDIRDCLHTFRSGDLPSSLGYPYLTRRGIVPGCVHYPVIEFAKKHPYPHYWVIENDVEFSGDWENLIAACSKDQATLIAAHVTRHETDPNWIWWRYIMSPLRRALDASKLLRAFFPVYRISRDGLLLIDRMQRSGWRGHYEAIIPTLLNANGMEIRDLRHIGPFYLGTRQDPPHINEHHEQLSTLRWRPQVTHGEFVGRFRDNVIFHPVKEAWTYNGKDVDVLDKPSNAAK